MLIISYVLVEGTFRDTKISEANNVDYPKWDGW